MYTYSEDCAGNFSIGRLDGKGGEREMEEMPDVKMNTIGERMRFLREKVNLKQSAFAERVLVSQPYQKGKRWKKERIK